MAPLCYLRAGACALEIFLGWDVSGGLLGTDPSTECECAGLELPWVGSAVRLGHPISQPETSHITA